MDLRDGFHILSLLICYDFRVLSFILSNYPCRWCL